MLDIVPKELSPEEERKGLTIDSKVFRNKIVNDSLQFALKSNPSPIYRKSFATRIETGNFDDDMAKIKDCEWIIEVVIERLDIKQQVFENVEKHRTPGTLISTNTSGIPIHMMLDGRSEDFRKHFCGTHFFNPPRYLQLLEIIPSPETDSSIIDFMMDYGKRFLGKKTVLCKDTPAFIANRVGVYSIMSLFHIVKEMGLTVEEVDKLSGPVLGRPKSATFRTCDVVGLDTLVHVANGLKTNCPNDEEKDLFELPDYISKMVENNWLGSKTKQGFYKKEKDENGKSQILALDLNTLEYKPSTRPKFATLEMAKPIEDLHKRTKMLFMGMDKAGEFYRKAFSGLMAYVSNRIPEITEDIYKIDDALKAGFGWELGPFETWDVIGLDKGLELIGKENKKVADWVTEMKEAGCTSFYKNEKGQRLYYDIHSKTYKTIPGTEDLVMIDTLREENKVWGNSDTTIIDLGDGIINLEFHTKMNTIGSGVIEGINKAIDLAENDFQALVVGNQGANFSVGANIGMIFMMAAEQEYDELNMAIKYFQDTMMRMRYSAIPTIAAPHGMTLGGGCELSMHADKVVAAAETYIGLVEFGVGVIPGGGGSKEMALRAQDLFHQGDVQLNVLQEHFLAIGMAKVATSAYEAFDMNVLQKGKDVVVVNRDRQIAEAKKHALLLADAGYTQKPMRKDVLVLGKQALGTFMVGTDSMKASRYISEHDQKIANKLAYVMAGGDLSEPTRVSEQYLLDIEREAFLSLCTERKTLERIQHMLKTGKPLRN